MRGEKRRLGPKSDRSQEGMESAKSMQLPLRSRPAQEISRPAQEISRGTRKPYIKSVTREEINRFWTKKKMVEEEHLFAAQKAAARLRAKALTVEDYRRFEDSLKDLMKNAYDEEDKYGGGGENHKELRVGIKDWWTKSKYAYLNQPATKSVGEDARAKPANSYVPQRASTNNSSAACLYASSFGVSNIRPFSTKKSLAAEPSHMGQKLVTAVSLTAQSSCLVKRSS